MAYRSRQDTWCIKATIAFFWGRGQSQRSPLGKGTNVLLLSCKPPWRNQVHSDLCQKNCWCRSVWTHVGDRIWEGGWDLVVVAAAESTPSQIWLGPITTPCFALLHSACPCPNCWWAHNYLLTHERSLCPFCWCSCRTRIHMLSALFLWLP